MAASEMDALAVNIRQTLNEKYDWIVESEPYEDGNGVRVRIRGIEGFGENDLPPTFTVGDIRGWAIRDVWREFGFDYDIEPVSEDEFLVRPMEFDERRSGLIEDGRELIDEEWDDEEMIERAHEIIDAVEESRVELFKISYLSVNECNCR